MRIRVSYTIDLDAQQVEEMLALADCIGMRVEKLPRLTLRALLRERGTDALLQAREVFPEQRMGLCDVDEGGG